MTRLQHAIILTVFTLIYLALAIGQYYVHILYPINSNGPWWIFFWLPMIALVVGYIPAFIIVLIVSEFQQDDGSFYRVRNAFAFVFGIFVVLASSVSVISSARHVNAMWFDTYTVKEIGSAHTSGGMINTADVDILVTDHNGKVQRVNFSGGSLLPGDTLYAECAIHNQKLRCGILSKEPEHHFIIAKTQLPDNYR